MHDDAVQMFRLKWVAMSPGTKTDRAMIRRRTYRGVLAPLLVLALLVCHGLLGAMHQVMPGTEVGEAKPMVGTAHTGMEHGSSPTGDLLGDNLLDHAVTLLFPAFFMEHVGGEGTADGGSSLANHAGALIFVVVALLWSLLKGAPGWRRVPLPGIVFRKPRPTAALRFPPAPALSALQVFRL